MFIRTLAFLFLGVATVSIFIGQLEADTFGLVGVGLAVLSEKADDGWI